MQGNKFRAYIEYFDINFPMHKVSELRKRIGHAGFHRVENSIKEQREKAGYYENKLEGSEGISLIKEIPGTSASYPFVTVLFKDRNARDKAMAILENAGLGVSFIYAAAITDYGYLREMLPQREFSRSRDLACRHITLSTNTFISRKEMDMCIKIIKNLDNF
jgi:dTDP-4-amino-4,6-dideoxygalactose transaminase